MGKTRTALWILTLVVAVPLAIIVAIPIAVTLAVAYYAAFFLALMGAGIRSVSQFVSSLSARTKNNDQPSQPSEALVKS